MGANAQTTVPTFTAAQVLTADQMNQSARTGVPVFADTTARDAAFGGAGEKTLAEGQLCYLESTNVVQYYSGAAWATLGPSGVDLLVANTTFTAVGTINIDNIFTTTYSRIEVLIRITAKSTTLQVLGKMRVGGVDSSVSYFLGQNGPNYAANTTLYGATSNNATAWALTKSDNKNDANIAISFYNAADALRTVVHGIYEPAQDMELFYMGGGHNVSTAYDGFSILTSTGTITGSYSVLGYKQ